MDIHEGELLPIDDAQKIEAALCKPWGKRNHDCALLRSLSSASMSSEERPVLYSS